MSPEPVSAPTRLGNMLVWLGGGSWRDVDEPADRSAYQSTGFVVVLAALVTWGVATSAAITVGGLGLPAAPAATLVVGLLAGALGRVLAAAPVEPGRRAAVIALTAVAVLVGAVLGELASVAMFTGPSARALDEQAAKAGAAVVNGERGTELSRLRTARAALDERVAQAITRRDQALTVARCEYRPAPGCPPMITGDPGRGPEAEQARAALAGADADLAGARADRDRNAPELDRAVATTATEVDRERAAAEALVRADTGLVTHWQAMNDYTLARPSALIPRLAAILTMTLVMLLPLLLRLLRGPSEQDRLTRARRLRRAAEQDADTAIAIRRAEVRAARELRHQDELLGLPRPAGPEPELLGLPGPAGPESSTAEVEPAPAPEPVASTAVVGRPALPAARPSVQARGVELLPAKANEILDKLPGPLPVIGRTMSGMARPFVPGPVARLVSDPTAPVRRARTIVDDVEEFQFSVLRRRKVTVTEEVQEAPTPDPPSAGPEPGRLDEPVRTVSVTQVHRESHAPGGRLTTGSEPGLDEEPGELERGRRALERGRRALGRGRRELPRG